MLSFLSVVLISTPSYSSGITSNANSATCDNSTLETFTGTSNLQANWSANEITVKWYADSEAEQPMTTNTCFYGPNSALTIPSASSMVNLKPGYTFAGWRVRQAASCSFASQVCSLNGSAVNGLTFSGYGYKNDSSVAYSVQEYNAGKYGLTTDNSWAAEFTNGAVLKGIASCNSTKPNEIPMEYYISCNSDAISPGNTFNSTSTGEYCWCKMTSYTPNNGSACNVADSSWVYYSALIPEANCGHTCAYNCTLMWDSSQEYRLNFRRAVFGVSQ